MIHCNIYIKLR